MKTKLKWRLSKLPTPSELAELVKDKIITQEEAHEVLFDQVTEDDIDVEALKSEIKFLRSVVEDLSKSRTEKVTVIEKHIKSYDNWIWSQPYLTYCTNTFSETGGTTYISDSVTKGNTTAYSVTAGGHSLNDLQTF